MPEMIAIVVTALVGFLFGAAANQATDFVKRADDCSDALSQYEINHGSEFADLSDLIHKPGLTLEQRDTLGATFNKDLASTSTKVITKCPIKGRNEYLKPQDAQAWNSNDTAMSDCFHAEECSWQTAYQLANDAATKLTPPLIEQANRVSRWGLVQRAWYVVTHLW
jgi:hypothetical protein